MTNKDAPGIQLNSNKKHWVRDGLRAAQQLGWIQNLEAWFRTLLDTAEDKL